MQPTKVPFSKATIAERVRRVRSTYVLLQAMLPPTSWSEEAYKNNRDAHTTYELYGGFIANLDSILRDDGSEESHQEVNKRSSCLLLDNQNSVSIIGHFTTKEKQMTDDVVPLDRLAKVYIRIRDKIAEITKDLESQVEALKLQQDAVASSMKDQLRAMNTLSAKTAYGTVSLVTKTRYVAQDRDAFKAFVLEHQAIDLLEMRIAQLNMGKFLEENPGVVPTGLNTLSEVAVSVRKPTKS